MCIKFSKCFSKVLTLILKLRIQFESNTEQKKNPLFKGEKSYAVSFKNAITLRA